MSKEQIVKQIEYYLGDENLAKDDFFRDLIAAGTDGYVTIDSFLKCNKVKKLNVGAIQIAAALKDSTELEVSADEKSVRRTGNKALPTKTGSLKKRDQKAEKKEEAKNGNAAEEEENNEPVKRDEQGRVIFHPKDFEEPVIVTFKTLDQDPKADEDYKVNWKDIENMVKADFNCLKVVYSRADKYEGHIAISKHKSNKTQLAQLTALKDKEIGSKKFSFEKCEGEELKEFHQRQGGHYQFCIAPKLRLAKKQNRKEQMDKKGEQAQKQKQSYTIAGVYYMDINKVKSKSRAILNIKKEGEKLDETEAAFIQELLKFHEKYEDKMKEFDHFEVDFHPEFTKTRCFFVVRKDGAKEDFSISKCIHALELKSSE